MQTKLISVVNEIRISMLLRRGLERLKLGANIFTGPNARKIMEEFVALGPDKTKLLLSCIQFPDTSRSLSFLASGKPLIDRSNPEAEARTSAMVSIHSCLSNLSAQAGNIIEYKLARDFEKLGFNENVPLNAAPNLNQDLISPPITEAEVLAVNQSVNAPIVIPDYYQIIVPVKPGFVDKLRPIIARCKVFIKENMPFIDRSFSPDTTKFIFKKLTYADERQYSPGRDINRPQPTPSEMLDMFMKIYNDEQLAAKLGKSLPQLQKYLRNKKAVYYRGSYFGANMKPIDVGNKISILGPSYGNHSSFTARGPVIIIGNGSGSKVKSKKWIYLLNSRTYGYTLGAKFIINNNSVID
ncbi:MAG: hypothetical protein PHV30_02610 [Candidatus Margulisbacteria bacterium]|nr:hypothetical protein [Candidatus Margulisiibacteriota bacterium]